MQIRTFTHALILAIVAIAAVDLGLRVFEPRLSGDIANTMSFLERVAARRILTLRSSRTNTLHRGGVLTKG